MLLRLSMCRLDQPTSTDISVTPAPLRLSVCRPEQPTSADMLVTCVPLRWSICKLEQPTSTDMSALIRQPAGADTSDTCDRLCASKVGHVQAGATCQQQCPHVGHPCAVEVECVEAGAARQHQHVRHTCASDVECAYAGAACQRWRICHPREVDVERVQA